MKVRRVDFSPDEWLVGTIGLRDDERGVYWDICALIYSHGGPIEEELIRRRSSSHGNAFLRIMARLEKLGKIIRNGSEIDQKRCGIELENAQIRSQNATDNARKRWKNNKIPDATAYANHQPSTITTNHHQKKDVDSPQFAAFWLSYPNKVGKGAARKALTAALKKTSIDNLLAGIDQYKHDKPEDRPWCNPTTWLNQERWTDELRLTNGHDISEYHAPTEPAPKV